MKKEILKIQLIITIIILLVAFLYFCYKESNNLNNIDSAITFNKESGFYTDSIIIKLYKNINLPFGTKIYYTLDGNDPTNKSNLYKNEIKLEIKDETKVYPLKVVAFYNGKYSKVIEKTYVIDKNINENDISIISITSNHENLYDYYKGILVNGVTYDNSKNDNPDVITGNFSNRGDEWIRKSEIIMFDKNGQIIIEKDIGLGVTGGSSASYKIKSLKITIGNELDLNNSKFNLNFYNKNDIANFSFINKYNNLKLRSGSQDTSNGNVRSSLMSRLSNQSNFDGCTTTKRSLVYLNGEFYGLFDIQQDYSNSYIANKYSLSDSNKVEKYKTSEKKVFNEADIMNYFNVDLNDEENRKKLEQIVDMDNYLLYYAIQILADNTDWPQNNFQMWKYNGEYIEGNKYTDGRYRFLIYDTDLIYADRSGFPASYFDTFDSIMKGINIASNTTFKNVLKFKYYRDKYIMITQDLLNTSFKEENILNILNEETKKIDNSYKKYYLEDDYNNFNNKIDDLKSKIKERDDNLLKLFEQYFNLKETHQINIETSSGIQVNFSNQELYENNSYSNNYYKDIDLRYTYKVYPGYEFKYWLVNNEKIYDSELIIDEKYRYLNEINIKAVAEYKREDNHLLISEIYAKGGSDWIKITNSGKQKIYLGDYYISNKEEKLLKYQLPEIYLNKNESIIINGEENYYSIGDYICNFKLKENEKVYLSKDNNIVDIIIVPRMSEIETYGRYNNSNTYKFFMNIDNSRKK